MSTPTSTAIDDKVNRSLQRLGFHDCSIRDFRDGQLSLSCPTATRDDQSLIVVALRLIQGVTTVVFEPVPTE